MTNIVNVNGVFIGSLTNKIFVSEFGNPHSWPTTGRYDLDNTVNNILEHNGEALVFTDNSISRIRGYQYDSMQVLALPENQGVQSSYRESLVQYRNQLFFLSNDGLCVYDGTSINVLSKNKFGTFPSINTPLAAIKDGVIYFFE